MDRHLRRIAVAFVMLLALTGWSGASTIPFAPAARAQTHSDELTLVPMRVDLRDTGDGWQDLTLEFAVRNDGSSVHPLAFPHSDKGTFVTLAEERTYETQFTGWDTFQYEQNGFFGFELAPGMAF